MIKITIDRLLFLTLLLTIGSASSVALNFFLPDIYAFFHVNDNKQQEDKNNTIKIDSPKGLWYNLGRFYAEQGNYTGSMAAFDRALSIDPDFVEALNSKAYVLRNIGNFSQAIEVFNQVLEKDSKHKWAWNNIGYSLLMIGNISDSVSYFDKALNLDPKYQSALNNKATAMVLLEKFDQAKKNFEKVINLYPNDKYATKNLVTINKNLSNTSLIE